MFACPHMFASVRPLAVVGVGVVCSLASPEQRDAFGIIVSYAIKVKLFLGALGGELTAELPFVLMHPKVRTHAHMFSVSQTRQFPTSKDSMGDTKGNDNDDDTTLCNVQRRCGSHHGTLSGAAFAALLSSFTGSTYYSHSRQHIRSSYKHTII